MIILIFFVAHWYLSLFCQTFFLHRYAAHGAFKMSRGWEKFFYILTFITQGSSYMSARTYALLHRLHHAYTDTEDDPHSPSFSTNAFDLMNQTRLKYADIFNNRMVIEDKFLKNLPDWPAFEKFAHPWITRLLWIVAYTAFYVYFATSPWQYLLLPITIAIGPVHGAVINWFAHKYGSVNFNVNNTSRNLFYIDVLMLGEAYHNNHHKFPSSINFGVKKNEIDPIYFIILTFNRLGIIRLNKLERKMIETEKATVYLNERVRKIS
ncbi:MAG: acyl-CoA desaturase [Chitinophagaceae bacterium]|nr:acyl-CoA desaturase [Chitinophagaceae bacterium]